jgi:large subunit ribosomal protein L5
VTDEQKKEKTEAKPEQKTEPKAEAKQEAKADKPKGEGKPKGEAKGKEGKKAKGPAAEKAPQKTGGQAGKKEKGGKEEKGKAKKVQLPKGPSPYETYYAEKCVPALKEQFNYKNVMQVPRLTKIVVNTSMADALNDVKVLETAAREIADITGQRPVLTKARKSIANFKLREGNTIGARVTLRGKMMYEFLNRLVNIALPRVRDFKGVSPKSFDGRGNYTLGLTEQIIFPEINFDKVSNVHGMNITFVTTARTDEEGRALLKNMGMPFRS